MKKQINEIITELLSQRKTLIEDLVENSATRTDDVSLEQIKMIDGLIKGYVTDLIIHNDKKAARFVRTKLGGNRGGVTGTAGRNS